MTTLSRAIALALALASAATAAGPAKKKVLIIGIDGCRPDALLAADAPNMHRLIREGAFSDTTQTGVNTVSGPGWSSMLTGVWADKHNVRNNDFVSPKYDRYPHFFHYIKATHPELVTMSVSCWEPIHSKIVRDADVSLAPKKDAEVAAEAAKLLATRDPDVLFLHFDEVDGAGHDHGFDPKGEPYLKAIAKVDGEVGVVLDALKARKTYGDEDWLILSSTDHGGTGKIHGQDIPAHRTIFLLVSGPSAEPGPIAGPTNIVDLPATALAHLGVAIDPAWGLDGRPIGLKAATTAGAPR